MTTPFNQPSADAHEPLVAGTHIGHVHLMVADLDLPIICCAVYAKATFMRSGHWPH